MTYEVKLDIFEGPLDLLLYLIKKNEVDIYNIPIAVITDQYLQHLEAMKSLNLDMAGEYLVMASTLIHIKSRTLLPREEEEDAEEADPRAELVRQLTEYQAFKEAALKLDSRLVLGRDTFKREAPLETVEVDEDEALVELNVFDLVAAFQRIVSSLKKEEILEIEVERMSLSDRINEIMERLQEEKDVTFLSLVGESPSRRLIVYTFLAVLELMKLRLVRAFQASPFGPIRLFLAVEEG